MASYRGTLGTSLDLNEGMVIFDQENKDAIDILHVLP